MILVAAAIDLDGHERDEGDQECERRGREPCEIASLSAREEAEADTEERAEQDEVREVAEVHDLRAELANEDELEEEDEGAAEEDARASGADAGEPVALRTDGSQPRRSR